VIHRQALHIAQQAFRATMNALARPGTIQQIPAYDAMGLDNPYLATLVLMLLDNSCSFALASANDDALAVAVSAQTYARCVREGQEQMAVNALQATFALITRDAKEDAASRLILGITGGSLVAPERGATLLLECEALAGIPQGRAAHHFMLEGPGVKGQQAFAVPTAPSAVPGELSEPELTAPLASPTSFAASVAYWFFARGARNDEFPCGIDFIMVDVAGNIVGLPRTTRVTMGR
jgi:alpha-D-ribose 1-methylphosphonate 5-triphosphate synthase subunit PhnH